MTFTSTTLLNSCLLTTHVDLIMVTVLIFVSSHLGLKLTNVRVRTTLYLKQTTRHALLIVLKDIIVVVHQMINVFPSIGPVMGSMIVKMDQMRKTVLHLFAKLECSNVEITKHAFPELEFVMGQQTVLTGQMKMFVILIAVSIALNVNQLEDVYLILGNVMEMMTAVMDQMSFQSTVIIKNVIRILNLDVTMESAYLNFGSVTMMMIVEMALMNLLIVVVT